MSSPAFNALRQSNVAALVALIKEAPTWDTVSKIIVDFRSFAAAHPTDTVKAAETLLAFSKSPDVPTIPDDDDPSEQLKVEYEVTSCVREMLSSAFGAYAQPTEITPTNDLLIAALISGASERVGLSQSPDQAGMIYNGLQFPNYTSANAKENEVNAIGACLALLVGGAKTWKDIEKQHSQFAPALKKLADGEVIKNENGKKLLQLTTQQVETGFSMDVDIEEAWTTLFPQA